MVASFIFFLVDNKIKKYDDDDFTNATGKPNDAKSILYL